jgi:hypothetical protein
MKVDTCGVIFCKKILKRRELENLGTYSVQDQLTLHSGVYTRQTSNHIDVRNSGRIKMP